MTRLPMRPGMSLAQAQNRLAVGGLDLPVLSSIGVVTATSLRSRATATASMTAHTKGAWTEIVAATASEASVITLKITVNTKLAATDTSTLLDVGIGAALSEVAVVPDLLVGYVSLFESLGYVLPVRVPKGSRVAIRCQSVISLKTVDAEMSFYTTEGRRSPAALVTMGATTATSKGTTLTAPGSTNTKGAWTEIVAATTQPFVGLGLTAQCNSDTVMAASSCLFDIGVGAAGSERVLLPDISTTTTTGEQIEPLMLTTWSGWIPAGSRLAVRYQSTEITNTYDVALYGVPPT